MHRRAFSVIVALGIVIGACGNGTPTYQPWGESVAVGDVLDGAGYTAQLALGESQIRLTATDDGTVLWSADGDTTLVHVEDETGTSGFRRLGSGPWTATDAATPTWPTALLVPSFADLLVAASAAEFDTEADGLFRFIDGPLDLSRFSLGPDLYLSYWLDANGRVVRWSAGSTPDAATIEWELRSVLASDVDGVPDATDALDSAALVPAAEFTGTRIAENETFRIDFHTETDAGTATATMLVTPDLASIEVTGTDSPPVAFSFRGEDVAVFADGTWSLNGEESLSAFADTLFVLSPDVTYAAVADTLIGADDPVPSAVSGAAANRYDVADVPATAATEQFGWPDATVQIWVTDDGLPLQWEAVSSLGRAAWRVSDLGGGLTPLAPPDWSD